MNPSSRPPYDIHDADYEQILDDLPAAPINRKSGLLSGPAGLFPLIESLSYAAGFLTAFFSGVLTGSLAWRFSFVRELLNPVISAVKSIPVASFVILSLIWIGSENLSVFIAFLVVFPMIYTGTIAGLSSTDKQLLEMAQVFSMPARKKLWYIYRPALIPYLSSSCNTALGMSWKSGIAAEVIGVPASSIGENLYMAKIYLSTEELFAWTLVIIVISALFEKLFLMLLNLAAPAGLQKRKEAKS